MARDSSVEVSSGGLAGSSFVGSLVNLFPGWRDEGGQDKVPQSPECGSCGQGPRREALRGLLAGVWPLLAQEQVLVGGIWAPAPEEARIWKGYRRKEWPEMAVLTSRTL